MINNSSLTQRWYIFGITLVATLGGLLFGYDTAVISGATSAIKAFFIAPLHNNPETAHSIIIQFRIAIIAVVIIIFYTTNRIMLKLFGKQKSRLISAILFVIMATTLFFVLNKPVLLSEKIINSLKGFTISSALIGCIIGGSIGGFISRKIGRKKGLLTAAILFTISAIGSSIPDKLNFLAFFGVENIIMFIIYRVVGGIGVGLASMLAPMYIAEIAPSKMRGKLVSWNQFAIIFGMLVVYFVNYFIAKGQTETWLNTIGWRWMFASETIPAMLFMLLLIFVPETPRYLVLSDKPEEARKILSKITGKDRAQKVLGEIQTSLKEKSAPWLSYGGMVIILGILLSVFQQFVGINVVLYYAPEIFRNMGSQTDVSLLQTVTVGIINLSFTVVAIYSVDKFGRKPLQIIGALGMAFSMFALGFSFYLEKVGIGSLIFMLTYTASFAMSWGPVTWVLLSEIFPNNIRGAMSIAVAAQWIANLIISWTFPIMNDNSWLNEHFNHGFGYWIYGIMGILAALFVWKLLPETKGKTLEQIETIWKK
jgi:MFS transporter, SP family, xylose:H+ symportor